MPTPPTPERPASGSLIDESLLDDPSVRVHARYEQMFPVLSEKDIDRLRRFGCIERHEKGAYLYRAGSFCRGSFVLLSGKVRIVAREGLRRERVIHTYTQRGEFTSDVAQLSNKPAVVDAHVIEDVEAILLRPDGLRAVMISEADLGERIMRALILRRVLVFEGGHGVVLVGASSDARLRSLQNFLIRNVFPSVRLDADTHPEALELLKRVTPKACDFPLVVCPNGTVLHNPDQQQLASCLGLIPDFDAAHVYDVVIVGAGPAGLATAVYAASEGLSVAALDCRAPGGQAGSSSRIENYLGFPMGITGLALAGRALVQAQKFGAHIAIPCEAKALRRRGTSLAIEMADGRMVVGHTVVVASGADYRHPDVQGLSRFEGSGVYYWATPIEARLCRDEPVALVGGGNSAGQAVVYLASHAEHVHLFIRGASLRHSMSHYLIERIGGLANVTLHPCTDLQALDGDARLERIRYRGTDGVHHALDTHHLFVFVGAQPRAFWLQHCGVALDDKGFVLTGADVPGNDARAMSLQTSAAGVFAIGDVRSGSIKRVASAVGEGAAVVAQIHAYLQSVRA